MWGRRLDAWQKYLMIAVTGVCCACYFTYQEFVLALEKHNKNFEAKMNRLSKNILTPSQLRSLLKDRLKHEINDHQYKGELEKSRIKRDVPNFDYLQPIDKKILELLDVVEAHNRKRNFLRSAIKEKITESFKSAVKKGLTRKPAIKYVTATINKLFAKFTLSPNLSSSVTRESFVVREELFGVREKGHVSLKMRRKWRRKISSRRGKPSLKEKNLKRIEIYKRAIQEELTDEYIQSAGFQLSEDFLMSGPSKDLFITNKWKTWLIFVGIQVAIYYSCLLAGILNSYCAIVSRVLNVISYARCVCISCLKCKPRDAIMEMAVKFYEFFDIEVDTEADSSQLIQRLLPEDFPLVMGRTVLTQLEPYRKTNMAIKHSYEKIADEVEQMERELEARGAGKSKMEAEMERAKDLRAVEAELDVSLGGENVIKVGPGFYDDLYDELPTLSSKSSTSDVHPFPRSSPSHDHSSARLNSQ